MPQMAAAETPGMLPVSLLSLASSVGHQQNTDSTRASNSNNLLLPAIKPPPSVEATIARARKVVKKPRPVHLRPAEDADEVRELRSLRRQIEELETDMASELESTAADSRREVEAYAKKVQLATSVEAGRFELRALKDKGVDAFLHSVADRNIDLSQLRNEYRLRKERERRFADKHFPWFKHMEEAFEIVRVKGYENATGWRGMIKAVLVQMEKVVRSPHPGLNLLYESFEAVTLRALARDINASTAAETVQILKQVEEMLLKAESRRNLNFMGLKDPTDRAFKAWKSAECVRNNTIKYATSSHTEHKLDLLRSIKEAEEALGIEEGSMGSVGHGSSIGASAKAISTTTTTTTNPTIINDTIIHNDRSVIADSAASSLSTAGAPQAATPELESQGWLKQLETTSVSRLTGTSTASQVHHLLVRCGALGDWKTALRTYQAAVEKRVPPSMPTTFQLILTACKHADPPESGAVLDVLEEVEAQGFAVTRELYHLAIDVCAHAGAWRRALQVFNRMAHQGLEPNTHTYALVVKAGATAKVDPAEVYEGLKFAGVPIYLSYTAAAANALNRTAADVPEWLQPPKQVACSEALFQGRATSTVLPNYGAAEMEATSPASPFKSPLRSHSRHQASASASASTAKNKTHTTSKPKPKSTPKPRPNSNARRAPSRADFKSTWT